MKTNGAFLLFEDRMEQGKMTPLHSHPDSDETMYVLDGEILMHMDGEEYKVSAGGVAVAPRGLPHLYGGGAGGQDAMPPYAGVLRGVLLGRQPADHVR